MKHYTVTGLLFICLLFSCMKEDLSECPEENLLLRFSYVEEGTEGFQKIASSVDVLLFDSVYQLAAHHRIENAERVESVHLIADPGNYEVVCWANSGTNTSFEGLPTRSLDDYLLKTTSFTQGDSLYYTPASVTVKSGVRTEETLLFSRSHRVLHVYVEGMEDFYYGENLLPRLQVTNIPGGYDFRMQLQRDALLILEGLSRMARIEQKQIAYIPFFLPVAPIEDSTEVRLIKNTDNSILTQFLLNDYLEGTELKNDDDIHIHIGFFSSGIEITVPGWGGIEGVEPGW